MNIATKMLTEYCRWIGQATSTDNGGRVCEAPPACQITNRGSLCAGDYPFMWCTGSESVQYDAHPKPILAGYIPNRTFDCIFTVTPNDAASVDFYYDRHYPYQGQYPMIYRDALWKMKNEDGPSNTIGPQLYQYYVRLPQEHCERLGFVRNANRDWNYSVTGWMHPGGQASPPIAQNSMIWKCPAGSNLCMSLIGKEDGKTFTGTGQDLEHTSTDQRDDGGTYIDSEVNDPGFENDAGGAEVWAGYNPSILNRWGDTPVNGIGGTVKIQDYDEIYEYTLVGTKWRWMLKSIVNQTLHTYEAGQYDWRFLTSFINRTHWIWAAAAPGATRTRQFRHKGPMYWNTSDQLNPPTGVDVDQIIDWLSELLFDDGGNPDTWPPWYRDTLYDIKIHAGVWIMRCSPDMVDYLSSIGYDPIVLSSPTAYTRRVWCYTNIWVSARQAMPTVYAK